jgi:hypothetical protein
VVENGSLPKVLGSIAELVDGATDRQRVHAPDGKSGSTFERLQIDGEPYFLKSLSHDDDWIMRVTHDTSQWPALVWRAGIYHSCPSTIDHTIVALAVEGQGSSARLAFLMRDVGPHLIPEGDEVVPLDVHVGCIGLCDLAHRFKFFAPANIAGELVRHDVSPVLVVADQGWQRLPERAPRLYQTVTDIHAQPAALTAAVQTTPQTFVAGDWKMGNLGRHPDGRTILLDWAYPGEAPGAWDLAWYLALNRARLPQTKEDTIETYSAALTRAGVDVDEWFEKQIDLCLLGAIACFGWEKALGDDDELAWWEDRADRALRWLV